MATMATKRRRGNGEGSLSQIPDGRWMARFFVTLPDGSRKRRHITLKDKDEVMRRMRQEMSQSDKGLTVHHERHTVASWLNYWLAEIDAKQVKDSTLGIHQDHCHKNIIPEIGNISLLGLKPDHVRRMIANWDKRGMGTRSQQIGRDVISAALRDAMKLEYIHRNVARLVDKPKHTPKERTIWTPQEAKIFLEAMKEHRFYGLFLIFFYYGVRRGEASGLRWMDVDFDRDIIHLRQQVYLVGHKTKIGALKTQESRRRLDMTPAIKEVLLAEREKRGDVNEGDLIYLTLRGNPLNGRSLLQMFDRIARKNGLPRLTLHEIRHTVTSLMHNQGVSPKAAQAILGHKSIVTTLQVYTHCSDDERSDALRTVAAAYN